MRLFLYNTSLSTGFVKKEKATTITAAVEVETSVVSDCSAAKMASLPSSLVELLGRPRIDLLLLLLRVVIEASSISTIVRDSTFYHSPGVS